MNKEIKKKWVEALRSGEYKQGRQGLKRRHECTTSFCCLGVLCDLAEKESIVHSKINRNEIYEYYDGVGTGHINFLPLGVIYWAELEAVAEEITMLNNSTPSMDVKVLGLDYSISSLAVLNDTGLTFNEIADIIEKQL